MYVRQSRTVLRDSYNRYLAIAARALRRSLKEGPRLQAEKRGEMDLRFARWEVGQGINHLSIVELMKERQTGREQLSGCSQHPGPASPVIRIRHSNSFLNRDIRIKDGS